MGDDNGEQGQPQQQDGEQRDYAREDQGRGRSRDREAGAGKERGVALRWNMEKGFGFIKPDAGGEDLFCHFSCVEGGNALKEGTEVFYAKIFDERKGKDRAEQVSGPAVCNEDRDAGGGGGGFGGDRGGGGGYGGGGGGGSAGKERGVAQRWNGEKGFG